MSHAARPIETAMLDRGENVRRYQHETDIACPPQLGPKRKSIRHPQFAADETFASHSSPRFLREQHRHVSLSAPKCGSVFRLHRSIPLRSGIGGRCALESRQSFAHQPRAGSALRRFLFSSLTSTIKTQLAKRDGNSGKTPRQTYARISSTLHKMAALTVACLKATVANPNVKIVQHPLVAARLSIDAGDRYFGTG